MHSKLKRTLTLIFSFILLLCSLSGCSPSVEKDLVGQWYNEDNDCLDVRSDGSWKLEGSYGSGTWKILDDKTTVEFIDFYGDTQKSAINQDELGEYIDFGYYGDFYKNSYPSDNEIESVKTNNAIEINPFENLSYEISGISPFCEIAINNSACSDEVQRYITYSLDKETYANGETAVITATLSEHTGDVYYKLSASEIAYLVSDQPEYISSIEASDLLFLENELSDELSSVKSSTSDSESLFNLPSYMTEGTHFKSCDNIEPEGAYLLSLKTNKISEFGYSTSYNQLIFVYTVDYTWAGYYTFGNTQEGTGQFWVAIYAKNIVKHPDGSISWGTDSSENYEFTCNYSQKSLDDCISTLVMSNSDKYNISQVS